MSSELTCTKCKFCVDKLRLGEITDFFTITKISSNSFSITDGESAISLRASYDNSIIMHYDYKGKHFCAKGYKFAILYYISFCMISLYDESSNVIFTTCIEKATK